MMTHRRPSYLLAAGLFGIFAFSACTSSPDEPDDKSVAEQPEAAQGEQSDELPPLDVDRSDWSDERQAVDASVDAFLAAPNRLNEAMQESAEVLADAAADKADQQQRLERRLTDQAGASSEDDEIAAWSGFRITQTYLNFGCQLQRVGVPDGIPSEQEQEYRLAVADLIRPLFDQTQQGFSQVQQRGVAPWSDHAAHILDVLDQLPDGNIDTGGDDDDSELSDYSTEAGDMCTALEDYWQIDADDVRLVDAEELEEIGVREVQSEELDESSELDSEFQDTEVDFAGDDIGSVEEEEEKGLRGDDTTGGGEGYGRVGSLDNVGEDGGGSVGAGDRSMPSPTTELKDPTVGDHCDDAGVRRVVQARENAFQHCYERNLQTNPELGGEITYSWTIDLDGSVTVVEIDDSSMDNDSVESCHRRIIERLRFAEPDGDTCDVAYPMEFTADGDEN